MVYDDVDLFVFFLFSVCIISVMVLCMVFGLNVVKKF